MDTLGLSLRQKKLLHLLRGVDTFTTGGALAKQLGVTARTIRTDVAGINKSLAPYNARIYSEHSKGYLYVADDPQAIQNMSQLDTAFFSRDERVRYLAFRFCLSDEPLNIYDLEDEIYVSHTTLEHDLRQLKMNYVFSGPKIDFIQDKDSLSFESDERKRRAVLNHLFHADWDYHSRNNAYYGYHFLDQDFMDQIMAITPPILAGHNISMEDPSLVSLNLAIAIMIHRVKSGHTLSYRPVQLSAPEREAAEKGVSPVLAATDDLFSAILKTFGLSFSAAEQEEIAQIIDDTRMTNVAEIRMDNVADHFSPSVIDIANAFLERVKDRYGLNFANDEDFYITLLSYISCLQSPRRIVNEQVNSNILHQNLLSEFEIAWEFQQLAQQHLGYYITETEIMYLAQAVNGALEFFFEHHPEYKLKTVICCHLNMTSAWTLKRKVLSSFDKYLEISDLIPVNAKNSISLKNVDLILSTVRKKITDYPGIDTIRIGYLYQPRDYLHLSEYIRDYRLRHLCPSDRFNKEELIRNITWMEDLAASTRFEVIEAMAGHLITEGIVPQEYESDILRREAISTFCIRPDILFLHSTVPAAATKLCIAVFQHRVSWNSHKIRMTVMGAFKKEDASVMLRLNQILNSPALELPSGKEVPTREIIVEMLAAACAE